jgi:NADH-quinone oxidoreductase subunit N
MMPVFVTLDSVMGVTVLSILTLTSAITMTWGNLSAIWQNSIKRLLAYSSIAHAGYLLMGFAAIAAYPEGELHSLAVASILFYLVVYMFMNFGAFLVVDMVDRHYGGDGIKWFRGLGKNSPMLALALAVCLFSLTGIPPLAGFIGKFYLFAALIKGKLFILPMFAIANTVVSLFYYIRIVRDMFLFDPEGDVAVKGATAPRFGVLSGTLAVVTIVPTVVLGLFWNQLAQWISLKVW